MKRILIVTALEREIAHFVSGWPSRSIQGHRRQITLYERGDLAVVAGGIGSRAARVATDAAFKARRGEIDLIISAGLAGALVGGLKVGDIFRPGQVIDEADSLTIPTSGGEGKLVSSGAVASIEIKQILARRFLAQAVDMEAYAVADVAQLHRVPFLAVKAISDEVEFALPPLGKFLSDDGRFQTASFLAYVAIRPWLWPGVVALGSNGRRASAALCQALTDLVSRYSPAQD